MTRIFYIQTDGFGTGAVTANATRTQQVSAEKQNTPIVLAMAKTETETPAKPIKVANINAMSDTEKQAVQKRFIAQRLESSTVIRSVKMTKSKLKSAAAPKGERLFVSGSVVNARAHPTTSAAVLAKLCRGTAVVSTGQSDGVWAHVIVSDTGQSVWMHSKFLQARS